MIRNVAFTSSLLGLAAAAPQAYGGPSYPSADKSPSGYQSSHYTPHSTPSSKTPGGYSGAPYQPPVATSTHHITVTDHVTATDGGCSASAGANAYGGAGSSAAGASGSYAPNSGVLGSIASSMPLPAYTPAGPPNAPAPPAATLAPATGPEHNGNNLTHLAPTNDNNLYFTHPGADTALDHMFASLDMNFAKPAVVLENSAYIQNVACSADGLGLTFNGDEGYNYAKQKWPSFGGDFILVSYSDGCKDSDAAEHTFWQVTDATFDDEKKACDVKCSEVGIDKAANDMHAEWGSWAPQAGNTYASGGTPSQSGGPASSITPAPSTDGLDERGLGDLWDDLTSKAGSVVDDVTSKAGSVVDEVTSKAVEAADKSFATSFTMDINASPKSTAASAPWPSAVEIIKVKGVDTYCVGCGAKGHADVSGSADISFLEAKIKSGTFSLKGNLEAQLGLGLEGSASASPFSKSIDIVTIPLSPFEIPGILVLGPYINVAADVSVDLEASGKMMMQVGAKMPNFEASLDLTDKSKNKQSGFTPQISKKFEAEGEITVSTTLGLPVELGIGLDVRAIDALDLNVSISNTASVTAYGNYSNQPGPCYKGIGWGVHFNDDVDFAVSHLYSDNLFSWQSPDVASGCIGGKNETTSSSSAASTPQKTPGSTPNATPTGKHTGSQYSPTNSPTPGSGSETPTAKHSGSQYSPTNSATPGTSSATPTAKHSGSAYAPGSSTPSTNTPTGSAYQPPKESSTKTYPSASTEKTTLATSKTESESSKTSSSSSSTKKSTETPSTTPKYNSPK